MLLFEDITEWRKASALAEERRGLLELDRLARARRGHFLRAGREVHLLASGAQHLFGYAEEEVIGKATPYELVAGSPDLKPLMEECRKTGSAEGELTIRHKSGTLVPVLFVLGKLFDKSEQHVGYTAVVLDITERRRVAEELLREKQKLEHVVDLMGAGLALIGKDRRILWANRAISEWFGARRQRGGENCHEVYCRRDKPCNACPAEHCFATGMNSEMEVTLTRADGAMRQYHHAVTPVFDANGQVDHASTSLRDSARVIFAFARRK